jgi:hypothetical protein
MPNPSIAKAVASYAGNMNIGEYLFALSAYARCGPRFTNKFTKYSAQICVNASGRRRG